MVKNVDFRKFGLGREQRQKIENLFSECSQVGPSQTLEPEFIGRCWEMFEERLAEARHKNSGTTTVWEFLGHIPLFSHEVAAEIGETIRNPESPSPIARAIRTIPPERIFRDVERTVLNAPWAVGHSDVLKRALSQGMADFLNLTGGPVRREETNPDSSTVWTTTDEGSLTASYPSPTGDIHARIQLPLLGEPALVDLVVTAQDGTNSPTRTFPSVELAMKAADAFAARLGHDSRDLRVLS